MSDELIVSLLVIANTHGGYEAEVIISAVDRLRTSEGMLAATIKQSESLGNLAEKAIKAHAQINAALGLPEEAMNTFTNTLHAIHYLRAAERGDKETADRLRRIVEFEADIQKIDPSHRP